MSNNFIQLVVVTLNNEINVIKILRYYIGEKRKKEKKKTDMSRVKK